MATSNYGILGECIAAACLKPAAQTVAYGAYFHSLFKGTSTSEALDLMSVVLGEHTPQFSKLNAFTRHAGHLLAVVKPAMFAVLAAQIRPAQAREQPWGSFKYPITKEDERVIDTVLTYAPLRSTLRGYLQDGMRVRSLQNIQGLIGRAVTDPDFKTYLSKFIHRKMYFMTGGSKAKVDELFSEMQLSAVYALQRAYPCWSTYGHMLAIAKTAAHNAGQNAIQASVTDKRQSLVRNADGTYHSITMHIDSSPESSAYALTQDALTADITGSRMSDACVDRDVVSSLNALASSGKAPLSVKNRHYLTLLLGYHDADFSAYLGAENDDAIHSLSFQAYNDKACAYLGISQTESRSFLQVVKNLL